MSTRTGIVVAMCSSGRLTASSANPMLHCTLEADYKSVSWTSTPCNMNTRHNDSFFCIVRFSYGHISSLDFGGDQVDSRFRCVMLGLSNVCSNVGENKLPDIQFQAVFGSGVCWSVESVCSPVHVERSGVRSSGAPHALKEIGCDPNVTIFHLLLRTDYSLLYSNNAMPNEDGHLAGTPTRYNSRQPSS